jgi:hypothetical protein
VDTGSYSAPAFGDLYGDGRLDMVVGDNNGSLRFFENTGTATNPVYVARTGAANPFNGLDVTPNSAPTFADVNGDRLPDLVVGANSGRVRYFQRRPLRRWPLRRWPG